MLGVFQGGEFCMITYCQALYSTYSLCSRGYLFGATAVLYKGLCCRGTNTTVMCFFIIMDEHCHTNTRTCLWKYYSYMFPVHFSNQCVREISSWNTPEAQILGVTPKIFFMFLDKLYLWVFSTFCQLYKIFGAKIHQEFSIPSS